MNLKETLTFGSLPAGLLACQNTSESTGTSRKSSPRLRFQGKTKSYNDASISVGKLVSIESIGITAGSDGSDYLSLTAYGSQTETYPCKQDINNYTQVGQVEYKTAGTVFNNYFAQVCSGKSGYHSTMGEIKILEYEAGKMPKGCFLRH